MSIISAVKSFWPLIFTFLLPRAINYYKALKTAYRTRPPPRPLSAKAARSLNILFCSVCFWLVQSFHHIGRRAGNDLQNVFATTNTRLLAPTDVVFSRLAILRPEGVLTAADELLKAKLTTKELRQIYLRYGPHTLTTCPFCTPDDLLSYTLYHLPTAVLLPHLLHIAAIGLATSSALTGPFPAQHRFKATVWAISILAIDLYFTTTFTLPIDPNQPSPPSQYVLSRTTRPLSILLSDVLLAGLIYTTSTARFFLLPFLSTYDPNAAPSPQDIEHLQQQSQNLLTQSGTLLSLAHSKLRALHVARSTVLRDQELKHADDAYWEAVVDLEGITDPKPQSNGPNARGSTGGSGRGASVGELESVWSDDEVQAALARTYGSGTVDVARIRKEADMFVKNVTKGLENVEESRTG